MKKLFTLGLAALSVLAVASCGGSNDTPTGDQGGNQEKTPTGYKNDSTPLTFSIQEVDHVFNPFFTTTGPDSSVVAMTQINMLGNDKDGKVTYGDNHAVVVKDYEEKYDQASDTTTYKFVLKNNIVYPNGSYLTMKDVLFNLYVYLDPAYTGSSTIYSTDIVGLQEYRTQQANKEEQDQFLENFQISARQRIDDLVAASRNIIDNAVDTLTVDTFKAELKAIQDAATGENNKTLVVDYDKTTELFKKELETDYSNNVGAYESITFETDNGEVIKDKFTTDIESFLYAEGYIKFNKKGNGGDGEFTYTLAEDQVAELVAMEKSGKKEEAKQKAIEIIMDAKLPFDIEEIVTYWQTATQLFDYLTNVEIQEYNQANKDKAYKNISGIKFANKDASATVNGKTYEAPSYDASGKPSTNEVLEVTINGVDPKAIWNFSFMVAPMYYYSDQAHIDAFDYTENFGVEYYSVDFMNNVLNAENKVGVPVGAGAYQASKMAGGTTNITAGDFCNNNVIYYEANPNYIMGEPLIKKIRYQVIASKSMVDALEVGEIDFVEPNAKTEIISKLSGMKDKGISYEEVTTSGYGYIGINASKITDLKVRQAIMHSIDTSLCVTYYKGSAKAIHRSLSTSSWAYPTGATPYYPFVGGEVPADLTVVNPDYADYVTAKGYLAGDVMTETDQQEFIKQLVEDAGYTLGGDGIYSKGSKQLVYTFTIAGSEVDHPAYDAFEMAREILNKIGFNISVKPDANALSKLASGALTVWAAAWSSTIDPDMYQVYHMDSKASSRKNWGYDSIIQRGGIELSILQELSSYVEAGRETLDQNLRADIYKEALDQVMKLAIELPTYQRKDLFAFNSDKIDRNTMTSQKDLSPYNGLTSNIWTLSLNEYK